METKKENTIRVYTILLFMNREENANDKQHMNNYSSKYAKG